MITVFLITFVLPSETFQVGAALASFLCNVFLLYFPSSLSPDIITKSLPSCFQDQQTRKKHMLWDPAEVATVKKTFCDCPEP